VLSSQRLGAERDDRVPEGACLLVRPLRAAAPGDLALKPRPDDWIVRGQAQALLREGLEGFVPPIQSREAERGLEEVEALVEVVAPAQRQGAIEVPGGLFVLLDEVERQADEAMGGGRRLADRLQQLERAQTARPDEAVVAGLVVWRRGSWRGILKPGALEVGSRPSQRWSRQGSSRESQNW